jgi:hypothetical protein
LWLLYQHVRDGSEGLNGTATLAGMTKMYQMIFSIIHHVHGCPAIELPHERLTEWHFLECIPATRKLAEPQKNVCCIQNTEKGENLFINVVSVKQGCV